MQHFALITVWKQTTFSTGVQGVSVGTQHNTTTNKTSMTQQTDSWLEARQFKPEEDMSRPNCLEHLWRHHSHDTTSNDENGRRAIRNRIKEGYYNSWSTADTIIASTKIIVLRDIFQVTIQGMVSSLKILELLGVPAVTWLVNCKNLNIFGYHTPALVGILLRVDRLSTLVYKTDRKSLVWF